MSLTKTSSDFVAEIEALYSRWGSNKYDEQISQIEHAVQCAEFARHAEADDELIVATLLHDIGHLLELEQKDGNPNLNKMTSTSRRVRRILRDIFLQPSPHRLHFMSRQNDFCAPPKRLILPNFRLRRFAASNCRVAKCQPAKSNASPNTPQVSVQLHFAVGMNLAKVLNQVV